MKKHNYFPAGLNVQNKKCLVIGAANDKEAKQKSERLKDAGADVTVTTPDKFKVDQITDQFFVVYCPKDNPEQTKQVAARCKEKRVLLCAIDQPAYCDVVNVSLFDKGRLRFTIGTGGAAPAVARKIREGLELSFKDVPLDQFLDDLAALREKLEHEIPNPPDRIPHLLKAAEGFEFKATVKFPPNWRPKK